MYRLVAGLLGAALAVLLAAIAATPASADDTNQKGARADAQCVNGVCGVGAGNGGVGNEGGGSDVPQQSSGGTVDCKFGELGPGIDPNGYADPSDAGRDIREIVTTLTENWTYVTNCDNGQQRVFIHQPGEPAVSPLFLARQAYDTLVIAFPDPSTSPSIEHDHLVGLATWLWIDPGGFEPVTATASIPGLSVTATATPTEVVWDMGDDTEPIVCDDAGTAYDTDRRPEDQDTNCSHVYQWHGDYTATATTTWEITWSATNGDGGTLPTIDRTTSFDLHVVERQAVVTG